MTLFYFELKRFIKNPKNKICLALLALIFFGLFVMEQTTFKQKFSEVNLVMTRENLQQTKHWVENLQNQAKLNPDDKETAQALLVAQENVKIFSSQLSALEKKDFDKFAELNNQQNSAQLKLIPQKDSDEYRSLVSNIKYYEAVKAVNGKMSATTNDTSESAFKVGYSAVAWLSSTAIFVLITVLIADTVSSEIESSQIRFYQLIGGRKFKHLLLKLGVPILSVLSVTFISFFCQYLIKGAMNSFGTWRYPYLMADGTIQPIWQVSLKAVLVFVVALIFIGSLGQLLALIFKKSLVVIGLIVVCLTGFLTLAQEEWFQLIKKFLPFEYLGYGQIINDAKILPNNALIIGLIYLVSLSLLFIVTSGYLYQHYHYRKVGRS
ncbi:ABC transporter permease [Lactococcus laudensis]|uniref:ABC transporter permease n=1 Tax=Pseudolactococcus laudensis TaxID=1494461 RepID=A0A7V8MZK2_9LACT|nr:ABC transporter permease [Lactococcus laudensis]MBA0015876.1 ABC transporter permease [Lactococcus laudensis]MBR2762916.1 ABC transporter permease [Lactococcus sp.]MBW9281173.1 ABC transporter permease [Lactococcus laudensis]